MLINLNQLSSLKLSFMENFGMAISTPSLLTFDFFTYCESVVRGSNEMSVPGGVLTLRYVA